MLGAGAWCRVLRVGCAPSTKHPALCTSTSTKHQAPSTKHYARCTVLCALTTSASEPHRDEHGAFSRILVLVALIAVCRPASRAGGQAGGALAARHARDRRAFG